MAIIQLLLALIVLGILYVRMIRREVPEPVSKRQAIVPVLFGVLSVPLSFILFLGIGTLLEEFFYGSDGITALLRLLTVGAHMIFGMIMSRHLGMAAHKKAAGEGGTGKEYILAIVVPVLIHTLSKRRQRRTAA